MTEIETNEVQNETKKNKTSHKQVIIGFVIGFLISATISLSIGMALLKNIDIKTIIILNKCQDIINQICIYDIDRQVAQDNIIKGYLKGLDDIHTEYYTPKEAEEISTHYEGEEFCGIGCLIDPTLNENGYYKISSLLEGGAKDAGVKSNSFVKEIDGVSMLGKSLDEVVNLIKGEEGTSVKLTLEENGIDKEYTIVRKKIKDNSVSSKILDNNIGYISVTEFLYDTGKDFTNCLKEMTNKGVNKLVIDLRDNGGGDVAACCDMLDSLIDEKPMFTFKTKEGKYDETSNATAGVVFTGDIVVLVNGNTASSSELFTGVLSEYGLVEIVGTQTYGKGIAQAVIGLDQKFDVNKLMEEEDYASTTAKMGMLKVTESEWCLPSGKSIHGVGLTPDYVLNFDSDKYEEEEIDNQLEKAVEILLKQ